VLAGLRIEPVEERGQLRAAFLASKIGGYFHVGVAQYAEARPLLERSLAIRETVLGPEHLDTAQSCGNLALLLHDQGDLAAARPLYERALAIYEKVLGPEHLDTAQSLNSLALLLHDRGDLAQARSLYERALAIYEKERGPEHPDTATVRDNLASLQD
jgi:tetratricopeptide (TPR) repeat protein